MPTGCGCLSLIRMSDRFTRVNVRKMTKLVDCAKVRIGNEVVRIKTNRPATNVALIGVLVFGCTIERKCGNHRFLLIP